jgi:UDP-GlcNAc:undecaprenyl-phosphate/decaprenyl-phosphate GlcNAc-1-phosphate transferase
LNYPIPHILISIVSTILAIYVLRHLALRINLVDIPNDRKSHEGHVPLIGGIAMYIGVVVSLLITSNELSQFYYFIAVTGTILILGVLDDLHNVTVSPRLLTQALVAIFIVTVADINIESFGNLLGSGEIFLNNWSYLISVIAIITAMNAINMSDGIHGLAGGTSLVTFASIFYLSIDRVFQDTVLIVFLFCLVIPVFLVNNICIGIDKSRRIFMGDSGSMLLGLVIAWALIDLSQGEERSFSPVTALWLFAFPLIELSTAVLRRLASRRSPFKPDLFHSHHQLIRLDYGEKTTLLGLICFSLLMAVFGILGELYGIDEWVMFVLFLLVFVIYVFLHVVISRNIQIKDR